MITTIDLNEDAVYIVQNGKRTKITPKDFGEDKIVWKHKKILDVVVSERVRFEGQEVI